MRKEGRVRRLLNRSPLPLGKTSESFDFKRLLLGVSRLAETLRTGTFLNRQENVLIFGRPDSGKTHLLCALTEQLIHEGRSVLFTTCSLLVQQLLLAMRDLRLPKYIKQLASFEDLVIDDLGYVQQSREEMEVLFTLLAERYERGSVMLTSNRSLSSPQRDRGIECSKLPSGNGQAKPAISFPTSGGLTLGLNRSSREF